MKFPSRKFVHRLMAVLDWKIEAEITHTYDVEIVTAMRMGLGIGNDFLIFHQIREIIRELKT
jgi:hypothetical protein